MLDIVSTSVGTTGSYVEERGIEMLNYRLMPLSLVIFDDGASADGNGNAQGVSTPAMPTKKVANLRT